MSGSSSARRKNILPLDCYETLGISTDATLKDINSAYKRLALKHHPDKTGGDDNSHEFQKIQEAVEILRDPIRRSIHDEQFGPRERARRAAGVEPPLFAPGYTGWRPHNPWWWNMLNPRERYIYSYRHSVHMDPTSADSLEELARCERERQENEDNCRVAEDWMREPKEEVIRKDNMDASGFGEDVGSGMLDPFGIPDGDDDCDEGENSVEGGASIGDYMTAASQNPSSEVNLNHDLGEGDHKSLEDSALEDDAKEHHAESTTSEEADSGWSENGSSIYYDFSNLSSINLGTNRDDDSSVRSSIAESASQPDLEEMNEKQFGIPHYIKPFIPYFTTKLSHESGRYTSDDLRVELKGMVMETFCGWLEDVRLTVPGAKAQGTGQGPEQCRHLGFWVKQLGVEECGDEKEAGHSAPMGQAELETIMEKGLERVDQRKNGTEKAESVLNIVARLKDILDKGIANIPHAALPWAIIASTVDILAKTVKSMASLYSGVSVVLDRINWHAAIVDKQLCVEDVHNDQTLEHVREALEKRFLGLYEALLFYLIKSVRFFYRNQLQVFLRAFLDFDDWEEDLKSISDAEDSIRKIWPSTSKSKHMVKWRSSLMKFRR